MAGIRAIKAISKLEHRDKKCLNAFNSVLDCSIENLEKEFKSILSYDFVDDYQIQALTREAEHRTYCSLNGAISMLSKLEKINYDEERALHDLVNKRINELRKRYDLDEDDD